MADDNTLHVQSCKLAERSDAERRTVIDDLHLVGMLQGFSQAGDTALRASRLISLAELVVNAVLSFRGDSSASTQPVTTACAQENRRVPRATVPHCFGECLALREF